MASDNAGSLSQTARSVDHSTARFRRNVGEANRDYVSVMTTFFDIDPRIARLCLHAGRLQAGI
jgi:hypothetical protein